jgi:predicted nucleic acid-binding protein
MLELLDTEHEECFITNKQTEGYPLSRIRTMLGTRHQKAHALPKRDLEKILKMFESHNKDTFDYISFKYPVADTFWDKAEDYCNSTEISVEDALHLALAQESECNILVTRDNDFRILADDYIIATSPEGIDIALAKLNKS